MFYTDDPSSPQWYKHSFITEELLQINNTSSQNETIVYLRLLKCNEIVIKHS